SSISDMNVTALTSMPAADPVSRPGARLWGKGDAAMKRLSKTTLLALGFLLARAAASQVLCGGTPQTSLLDDPDVGGLKVTAPDQFRLGAPHFKGHEASNTAAVAHDPTYRWRSFDDLLAQRFRDGEPRSFLTTRADGSDYVDMTMTNLFTWNSDDRTGSRW